MNTKSKYLTLFLVNWVYLFVSVGFILSFFSCGNSPQPSPPFSVLRAVYKTSTGQDLLDQSKSNSFKTSDIKVISRVDYAGAVKDVSFNNDENGIKVYFDNDLKSYYFDLSVPTNADKNPIATFISLSSTVKDTVTYSFGYNRFKNLPDKIYYNKVLVWEAVNIPAGDGKFPPIVLIK